MTSNIPLDAPFPDAKATEIFEFLIREVQSYVHLHLSNAQLDPDKLDKLPTYFTNHLEFYGYIWLRSGHPLRFVLENILWRFLDASIFSKYVFGADIDWDQKLRELESTMARHEQKETVAAWRAFTVGMLYRNPDSHDARLKSLQDLVDSFDEMVYPLCGEPSEERQRALLQIATTAAEIHFVFRKQQVLYELTFLESYTHTTCDLFDPELMFERTDYDKIPEENMATLIENEFRDATNRQIIGKNRETQKRRQQASEVGMSPLQQDDQQMVPGRENKVALFVTPALRKMDLKGTVTVLSKAGVMVGS